MPRKTKRVRVSGMSDFEDDMLGEYDYFDEYKVTCKFCGESSLRWELNEETNKWELMELDINMDEFRHKCKNSGLSKNGVSE